MLTPVARNKSGLRKVDIPSVQWRFHSVHNGVGNEIITKYQTYPSNLSIVIYKCSEIRETVKHVEKFKATVFFSFNNNVIFINA